VPNLLVIALVVLVLVVFLLCRTLFGRSVYAVGSTAESARLSGVLVAEVLVTVYALCGLLAGAGGGLLASWLNAGVPSAGRACSVRRRACWGPRPAR
jgi:ribose transport system permease protein